MNKVGIFRNIDFPDYCKIQAISASELKGAYRADTKREFMYEKEHREYKDNKGMRNGRIVDSWITHIWNPVEFSFEKYFITLPANAEKPRSNKKPENYSQEERLYTAVETEAKRQGKELISHDEFVEAMAQIESLQHGAFSKQFEMLIKEGEFQLSCLWEAEGMLHKGRPDCWLKEKGIIVDFKTTSESVSPFEWGETCFNFLYPLQAATYLEMSEVLGTPAKSFIFVAIRNKPPYTVNFLELPEVGIQAGRKMLKEARAKYVEWLHDDVPDTYNEISYLRVPRRFLPVG